jgi:hypothetical protein
MLRKVKAMFSSLLKARSDSTDHEGIPQPEGSPPFSLMAEFDESSQQ